MKDFNFENKEQLEKIVEHSLRLLENVSSQAFYDLVMDDFNFPCSYEDFVKHYDMFEEDENEYEEDFINSIFNIDRVKSINLVSNTPSYEGFEDIVYEVTLNSNITFYFEIHIFYSSYNGYESDNYSFSLVQPEEHTVIKYVSI